MIHVAGRAQRVAPSLTVRPASLAQRAARKNLSKGQEGLTEDVYKVTEEAEWSLKGNYELFI